MANLTTKLKNNNYVLPCPQKTNMPVDKKQQKTNIKNDNQHKRKPKANEHINLSIILKIFYSIKLVNIRQSQNPMHWLGCGKTEKK